MSDMKNDKQVCEPDITMQNAKFFHCLTNIINHFALINKDYLKSHCRPSQGHNWVLKLSEFPKYF